MRHFLLFIALTFTLTCCFGRTKNLSNPSFAILVFSKTAGFRHDCIYTAIATVRKLGQENNFQVDATEDTAAFSPKNLSRYKAVVFALTTGDILDQTQQTAFEGFIRAGGGYVGIHSAADTEYEWPWYGKLMGAYFKDHPPGLHNSLLRREANHPLMQSVPAKGWVFTDEIYNFRNNPRGVLHILATVDENTYQGGSMGLDHPIAWCHEFEGGRAWYMGLGHTENLYADPVFQQIILGGILYAAKQSGFLCE